MPSARKIAIVEKLKEKVAHAKALVFANYQGLTHKQLEELKRALKSVDAELVVTKNTLLARALSTDNRQLTTDKLIGPTATLFSYGDDVITPLRELAKTIKLLKLPTIKFAILSREAGDKEILDAEVVLRLATLPSREVLLAQLVGGMKAPLYGLHRALNWNLVKLVMTLKKVEKVKG